MNFVRFRLDFSITRYPKKLVICSQHCYKKAFKVIIGNALKPNSLLSLVFRSINTFPQNDELKKSFVLRRFSLLP